MTINVNDAYLKQIADGITNEFNYDFFVAKQSDLLVFLDGVPATVTAITGLGDPSGGDFTIASLPDSGVEVVATRELAIERKTNFTTNGDLTAALINKEFNYIKELIEQSEVRSQRGVSFSNVTDLTTIDTNSTGPVPNSSPRISDDGSAMTWELLATQEEVDRINDIIAVQADGVLTGASYDGRILTLTRSLGLDDVVIDLEPNAKLDRTTHKTLADWQNDTAAQVDDVVTLAEYSTGKGGGGTGDVINGISTVNGLDIAQHGTLPISIAIRIKKITTLEPFGLVDGQDSSDMFLRAVELQKAGVISKIVGTSGFEVTATKSVLIDYDNANIDFANMKITWDNAVDEKLKGTGFFELKAIPLFNVFSQVTSDIIKYSNVISVADGTKFSKGNWVSLRYTVAQDNSITPTVTPTGAGDFDEIIAKVTEVNTNDVTINLFKAYDYLASPPGGGELRLLVIDKVISGARLQDGNFDTNTPGLASKHNSPISLEYCVSSEFDHIECKNLVGTNIYAVSCSDLKITYPRNETPTGTGGGQGYNVQLINSTDCTVYSPLGIRVRHNVDFSGSSNCRVRDAISEQITNGALGSHGGYEHNLEYINGKDNNCAISYYIATSGVTFGDHSKNIKIKGATCNNTAKAIHAGSGTGAITKNVEIDDLTILVGATQNNFMVDIGSDNVTISNSIINGSINIRGANGQDETDFVISNTELNWLPGNGAVGNTVLKWSGLTGANVILQNCDTSGEFQVTELSQNIKLSGGKYTYVTANMFNQAAIAPFGMNRFSLKGVDINVPDNTTISDLVKAGNGTIINCESFIDPSSNLLFQIDGGATPGPVKINGNIGDMRYQIRRCTRLSFSNNDNKDGADEMLIVQQSDNANVILANNNLKKVTADAKCIRVVAGGHNFLQVSVSGNTHNGVFDLLTGSVEKTVGSANIFRPDGGDTNLQTSFRQAPDADHVYAANIGW